jgi:hypothetical protein
MLYQHWREWICSRGTCEEQRFESKTAAMNHITTAHTATHRFPGLAEVMLGRMHRGSLNSRDTIVGCPLCNQPYLTIKEYARHVGRHQKELSLFALPRLTEDEDTVMADVEASEDTDDESDESLDDDGESEGHALNEMVRLTCLSTTGKTNALC